MTASSTSKPRRSDVPTEHAEQVALIEWFDRQYPEHRGRLFAIPNGSHKSRNAASAFKREGLRKGVPDLCLPLARYARHALYIELKRQRGGRLSTEQAGWIEYLRAQGNAAEVCNGFDAARVVVEKYLLE